MYTFSFHFYMECNWKFRNVYGSVWNESVKPNRICAVWTQPFSLHCVCFSSGSSMSMGRSSVLFGRSWHFRVVGENVCVCVCARDRGSKAECVWECQSRASRCFANWTFFCGSARSVGSWGRTHPALILELQQKRRALQPPLALCKINGRVRPRDCLSVREKSQKGNETILHELPWEKNEWPDFWLHTGDSLVKWSRRVWKWN